MPQMIVFLDNKEDKKLVKLSKKLFDKKKSKAETIRHIIENYDMSNID